MKKRIEWIDNLKAISIFMVILVHIPCCPEYIRIFCGPFFLTTFLFSFGYTFNNKINFKDFLKKRINTLLIPLLILSSILIISRYIFSFSEHDGLLIDICKMILQIRGSGDDLWFIALIFMSSIIFYFISKLNNKLLYFSTLICLFICSYIYYIFGLPALPWHLHICGVSVFYIGIGYYFKIEKIFDKVNLESILIFISSFIAYIIFIILNGTLFNNITFSFYSFSNNIILYFIITLIGMIFNISLAMLIKGNKLMTFYGKNTMLVFAFHGKLYKLYHVVLSKILYYVISQENVLYDLIMTLIIFVLVIITLIPVIIFINKYLPILSGKKEILK